MAEKPNHYAVSSIIERYVIDDTWIIKQDVELYELNVEPYHNFSITSHDIIVHNFAPIFGITCAWLFGQGIEFAGASIGIACFGLWFGLKLKKNKEKAKIDAEVLVEAFAGAPNPDDPWGDKKSNNTYNLMPDNKPSEPKPQKVENVEKVDVNSEKFKKAFAYATNTTKLNHFFRNPVHKFDRLLNQLGGIENVNAQMDLIN